MNGNSGDNMKKALYKDIFIEILNTKGRFFSILIMISLGVFVYTGLNATAPIMVKSANELVKKTNMADLAIYNYFNFDDNEKEIIDNNINISELEYSHVIDLNIKNTNILIRLESVPKQLSKPVIVEGRLPKYSDEILLDKYIIDYKNVKMGDIISFEKENNFSEEDRILKKYSYKVVGFCITPEYLSLSNKALALNGLGNINGFGYIFSDNFNNDDYQKIKIKISKIDENDRYLNNDSYNNRIEKEISKLEQKLTNYQNIKLNTIKYNISNKINTTTSELNDKKNKLDSANFEILKNEEILKKSFYDLENSKNLFIEEVENNVEKIKILKEQLEFVKKDILNKQDYLYEFENNIENYEQEFKVKNMELENAKNEIIKAKKEIEIKENDLKNYNNILFDAKRNLNIEKNNLYDAINEIKFYKNKINENLSFYKLDIDSFIKNYEYLKKMGLLNDNLKKLYNEISVILKKEDELNKGFEIINIKEEEIDKNLNNLENSRKEIEQAKIQILKKEDELEYYLLEYEKNYDEFKRNKNNLEFNKIELEKSLDLLLKREYQLNESEKILNEKIKEIDYNYDLNLSIINEKQHLYDLEVKKFKNNYDKNIIELNNAKNEINKVNKNIKNIIKPFYTLEKRSDNINFFLYYDAAKRLKLLSLVFPTFFFMIASLVSLTTIKRMVDERRIQIGTLKALGYSNFDIMLKYLIYGATSSFFGWILGVIFGKKILSYIIFSTYAENFVIKKMADYISYNDMIVSFLVAALCTAFTAYISVKDTLAENTSNLLKPKVPKLGSKIFLENIGFIWKRLNFFQKVTFRNLFRYKSRMFMTVLGISGCCAILFMGYALKDSIYYMPKYQFEQFTKYDLIALYDENISQENFKKLTLKLEKNSKIENFINIRYESQSYKSKDGSENKYSLIIPKDFNEFKKVINIYHKDNLDKKVNYLNKGIGLSSKLADIMNKKVGDYVEIKDKNSNIKKVRIEFIFENYVQHYMYMSKEYYREIFKKEPVYNSFIIDISEDEFKDLNIEQVKDKLIKYDDILAVFGMNMEIINSLLSSLDVIIIVIIVVSAVLAFVVLFNLTNINISERIRELSTIKVLGFYSNEVTFYVYRETIILCAIGILFGYILGNILHQIILNLIMPSILKLHSQVFLSTYIISAIYTYLFSFIVMIFIHFKLLKINMIEALKSYE